MSKSKPAVNDLFGDDSDEEGVPDGGSRGCASEAPITASQIDSKVVEVADKLADFVSKNGRHYEDLTRQRNPGNTPFKFLWNTASKEYKYYEAKLNSLLQASGADAGGPGVPAQTHRPQQDSRSNSRHEQGSRSHYDKRQQSDSTYEQHDRRDGCEQDRRSSCRDRDERSSRYDREGRYSRDRYQDNRYERSSGARYHSETCDEPCRRFSEGPGHSRHSEDRYSSREQDDRRPYQQQQQHSGSTYTDEPASKRGKWESSSVLADSNNTPAGAAAGVSSGSAAAAPAAAGGTATLSAMEQYMQRLEEQARKKREDDEEEERRRLAQPLLKETAFDRRKVVAVFKDDGQRGHHLDDFIPKEELAKFMAQCGDKQLQQQVEQETAIGADNIGHKLLQKMGWKEGQGIGAKGNGRTAPVTAVKQDNLGLGAQAHGAVEETDDPFEQYRKRMMLGYKHRPNPLGNPRRAYY